MTEKKHQDQEPGDVQETKWIAEYFDTVACDHCEDYEKKGLAASSTLLLNSLAREGLGGKTLLDLGCGVGRFSVEALKRGASSSIGIDLSPGMISTARKLADEMKVGDRAKFAVGDAALEDPPATDLVVLDKVVCCYPRIEPLLSRAGTACKMKLGMVVPRDSGWAKIPVRIGVYLENLVSKVRKDPSRMYLHPIRGMNNLLVQAGLTLNERKPSGLWLVLVYRRD